MAKTGITFTYLSGGPESITNIVCLSSSPRLKGTVILTPFRNLTAFDGGDNGLENIIGISSLTALATFKVEGENTVSFDVSQLPRSLSTFDVFGQNSTTGNISALPNGLVRYRNRGVNTTTGNLSTLPNGIKSYDNQGNNTVYNYYNGASVGFGQRVWTSPLSSWTLQPALSTPFTPGVTNYIPGQPLNADTVTFTNNMPLMSNEEKMYIDMFVLGCKLLGLWNDMVCWPLLSSQNSGANTVFSLGGSGTFNGVLTGNFIQPNHNLVWTGQGLFSPTNRNRVTTQKQRSNYNQRTFYAVGRINSANYTTRARYMHSGFSEAQFLHFRQSVNGMHLNDSVSFLHQGGAGIAFTATHPLTDTYPAMTVGAIPLNTRNTWATHAATFSNRTLRNYRDAILRGTGSAPAGVEGSWADSITDGEVLTLMNSQEWARDNYGESSGLIGFMAFGADFNIGLTENQVAIFDRLYKLTLGRSLPLTTTKVPGMSPHHLATLVIDLSSVDWNTTVSNGVTSFSIFDASGPQNPRLNLLDYSYGSQLSAAIDEMIRKRCTVLLNTTLFLDPDAEAYKSLIGLTPGTTFLPPPPTQTFISALTANTIQVTSTTHPQFDGTYVVGQSPEEGVDYFFIRNPGDDLYFWYPGGTTWGLESLITDAYVASRPSNNPTSDRLPTNLWFDAQGQPINFIFTVIN